MTVILIALLLAPPVEKEPVDPTPKRSEPSPATNTAVQEMLRDVWKTPLPKSKKLGNSILQRARKQDASIPDVQYAYAVSLWKLGDLSAAETNLQSILDKDKNQPRVRLALAHLDLALERWPAAFDELNRLWDTHPEDPSVVVTLARIITFFQARPPAKFRTRDLQELASKVQAGLTPDSKRIYDQAKQDTEKFISDIPKIRDDLLEPVQELEKEAGEWRTKAEERDRKLVSLRTDLERISIEIDRINASGDADLAEIDRSIARARERGDNNGLASYQTQRQAVLERIDARVRAAQLRQRDTEIQLQRGLEEVQFLLVQANTKATQAQQAASEVDHFLSCPPSTWTPIEERDRLLAGEVLEMAERPKRSSNPSDTPRLLAPSQEAKGWLSLADTCRVAGKLELARKYYEKVIAEFPKTIAAEDARWQLDQMKEAGPPVGDQPPAERAKRSKRSRSKSSAD
jgi:tetratricopeptide (TPR) repeat protein